MDTTATLAQATRHRTQWSRSLEATRLSLLTRLKHPDDSDAWQRFFDSYGMVIHAFALKAGLSPTEAEEALQETLLSVAREMPGFRYDPAKGSFKAWLFTIARRRIVDQFRQRARSTRDRATTEEDLAELPDPAGDPLSRVWEEEWRQNQLQLAVARVKQQVSPRQWQVFDLAALQQWPTERICQTLGVNRAQIYMAKMRVGRMLKAEVQRPPTDAFA